MNADHTPDPEFVDHLAWELESTMRRQGSYNGRSRTLRPLRLRLGTTLALVVVSLFVGGAGAHAITHGADERAAALYIARGEALLEIARTRLEPVAQELARTQALVQRGEATEREFRQVEAQYMDAESEAKIRELQLAETIITGKEPNDALSAPRVDGRDFVTERLAAQRRPVKMRYELITDQVRRYEELNDAGAVAARELNTVQTEFAGVEEALIGLRKRIALRASFLAAELSATEVELRGLRLAAATGRETALRQFEILIAQHERFTQLLESGLVSESELQEIEAEMRAVEARVELADLELRLLDQKLEDASKE